MKIDASVTIRAVSLGPNINSAMKYRHDAAPNANPVARQALINSVRAARLPGHKPLTTRKPASNGRANAKISILIVSLSEQEDLIAGFSQHNKSMLRVKLRKAFGIVQVCHNQFRFDAVDNKDG